ncbi:MAG: hypothetical protein H7Y04_01070 [Verrucomicrobia bacterium]|nr:hypothetical protein [Cytophagales bacterium]
MAYNKFTLKEVLQKFNLQIVDCADVVDKIKPYPPSEYLKTALTLGMPKALKINTEKARSEFIVAPVLLEIQQLLANKISLFSGTDFNVDKSKGLIGWCDFLISLDPSEETILAPVISIVEAKKGDLKEGLGQCIAEMVAAQLFNQNEGNAIAVIYGAVTSGIHWKYLKLEGRSVFIEELEKSFTIADKNIDKLLGIFIKMLENQPITNSHTD